MIAPMGEVDPNTVRPGWVALLIVLALAGATVLLWRNMNKQMRRIDFDPDPRPEDAPDEPSPEQAKAVEPTDEASRESAGKPEDASHSVTERKPD